jgi:hypothetical protein
LPIRICVVMRAEEFEGAGSSLSSEPSIEMRLDRLQCNFQYLREKVAELQERNNILRRMLRDQRSDAEYIVARLCYDSRYSMRGKI